MRKKLVMLLMVLTIVLVILGCSTTQFSRVYPHSASVSFPAEGPYEILGRVDYVSTQGSAGYAGLLEHAKTIYPTADDVVNIIVDTEDTYEGSSGLFGVMGSSSTLINSVYTMSGIAIRYIK